MSGVAEKAKKVWENFEKILHSEDLSNWGEDEASDLCNLLVDYLVKQKDTQCSRKRCRGSSLEGDARARDSELKNESGLVDPETLRKINEISELLNRIRVFMKRKLPFGFLQEPTVPPESPKVEKTKPGTHQKKEAQTAGNAVQGCAPIYSVDAFLYDEEDIDQLVEEGRISRDYCRSCGSIDIGLAEFITHSFNRDQLLYLTCFLLPAVAEKLKEQAKSFSFSRVVDVGSRLGVVLWAMYFTAKCGLLPLGVEEIVGIEVDESFFKLQQEVGSRFCSRRVPLQTASVEKLPSKKKVKEELKLEEKYLSCRVVESDCFKGEGAKELADADVIILHNVFEYFSEGPEGHLQCWNQLRELVHRPGQILICFPSLNETLEGLERHGVFKSSKVSSAEDWISSYLDTIDVSDVAHKFFQFRQSTLDDNTDQEEESEIEEQDHSPCCDDRNCEGCCEEIPELLELVQNISVYRVK